MILFIAILAAIVGFDFWMAQVTVWGLSLFHVDSGIWGPYFLLTVFTSVVAVAVAIGKGD